MVASFHASTTCFSLSLSSSSSASSIPPFLDISVTPTLYLSCRVGFLRSPNEDDRWQSVPAELLLLSRKRTKDYQERGETKYHPRFVSIRDESFIVLLLLVVFVIVCCPSEIRSQREPSGDAAVRHHTCRQTKIDQVFKPTDRAGGLFPCGGCCDDSYV
jgi:hypothetical protein